MSATYEQEALFSKRELRLVFDHMIISVTKKIEGMHPNDLLNVSLDDNIEYLFNKNQFEPIELQTDKTQLIENGETTRETQDYGRKSYLKYDFFVFAVPFTGDNELFQCRPSSYTFNPPSGSIFGNEIQLGYMGNEDDPGGLKKALQKDIARIEKYVAWVRSDVEEFNKTLKSTIGQKLTERKDRLLKRQGMVASIGIPIRRRNGVPETYSVPIEQKKLSVPKPSATEDTFEPEPELLMQTYEDILHIIRNMVAVMEQSPKAFVDMDEPDLRTHFLVQLNGQFQGRATGETFNFQGKTDIIIKEQEKNLFIAECKIWKGPKTVTDTINQLLGYLTWRDTKVAILLFNRNRNLSNVLDQIPGVIENHPNFKRNHKHKPETEFRFTLRSNQDINREIIVTLMVFDVPVSQN